MKLEQAHIDQIRTAFEKMQSREDLLHVLNEAKPMVYGDKAVPFQLKQLTWYANPKLGRKRYTEFKVKKKSGAERYPKNTEFCIAMRLRTTQCRNGICKR